MGDPRKQRSKFSGPNHPWQKARIDEEKVLMVEYGLKNKKDLWRITSRLAKFKKQAKSLISRHDDQSVKEKELFIKKLSRLNLVKQDATLDDVLDLHVKDLLERRLQTILFRKGHARTIKQARQMIVHKHVLIKNQKMDVPSFLVPISMETQIDFHPNSPFIDEEHPERKIEQIPIEELKIEDSKEETKEESKIKPESKEKPKFEKKTMEVAKNE
jgi:small subunit ribosomal protein S4